MAIEFEKKELRSHEIKKRKLQRIKRIFVIIFLLVIIGFLVFAWNFLTNRNYIGYEVLHTTERNDSVSASYLPYGTGVLRYSKDGVMAMDGEGNLLWNGTYEMQEPVADVCGDYVVISDVGTKQFYIINGQGKMTQVTVLQSIIKAVISEQGVAAVLMDGENVNYIEVFDEEGTLLVESKTRKLENGLPLDFDLSQDGRKLVTSYFVLSEGSSRTAVTFYNYGEVGQSYTDRLVGAYELEQTIVPDVEFINNDTVVLLGDNKCNLVSMKEIPKIIYEEDITEEIKSVVYSEDYVGYLTENAEETETYQIKILDAKGNQVLKQTIDYKYNQVYLSGEELVFYSDLEWSILKLNGTEKLRYAFENNVDFISSVNNMDRYIVIDSYQMMEVKLTDSLQQP